MTDNFIFGEKNQQLFSKAKEKKFALPAINVSGTNTINLFRDFNLELFKVQQWYEANKLCLNIKKTYFNVFKRISLATIFLFSSSKQAFNSGCCTGFE